MQVGANGFLNGREVGAVGSGRVVRSCSSTLFRSFILFLIITNILAVLTESIPEVDRWAGNQSGNVFGEFEAVSVIIFTVVYRGVHLSHEAESGGAGARLEGDPGREERGQRDGPQLQRDRQVVLMRYDPAPRRRGQRDGRAGQMRWPSHKQRPHKVS